MADDAPIPFSDLVFTVPEAAAALKVSVKTIKRMIASGDIPVVSIRRRVVISRDTLLAITSGRLQREAS